LLQSLRRPFNLETALFILIFLVGVALRFYALDDLPHGIYHDEAYYGLDAVSVLEGARPIFFPANNGREPLYIYILSLSVAAFGRTPFGLRFASAIIGTLTMPVTYLLGRALFNRRVGLLATAICAVTFWPVALSRVSFRAGALPLLLGLAIALGWLGFSRRNLLLAILGGTAYGLAFNTYTAARVTPLALGVMAVVALLVQRHKSFLGFSATSEKPTMSFRGAGAHFARDEESLGLDREIPRGTTSLGMTWFRVLLNPRKLFTENHVREALAFTLAAIVVVAPLGFYALTHSEQVFAREGQVSIFETESGNPVLILLKHIWLALGMFGWHGDTIPRHNLPGRPVFDLWTFIFFIVGLGLTASRARRSLSSAFVLVWVAATLLPTAFAEDTPHFLRAIGTLPVLWLIPAVGLEALIAAPHLTGFWKPVRCGAVVLLLAASTFATAHDYFWRYANDPITNYHFEAAATDLAAQINSRPRFSNRIDNRLWDNFAALRFLIPDREGSDSEERVQLAVWPYEADEVRAAVAALPANSLISARRGELAKGDLESTPYSLYTLFIAEPVQPEPPSATFGGVIELRSWEVNEAGDQVQLRLRWGAGREPIAVDYHVYVHVLIGGEISAQTDGEPLKGLYHFSWLRPGDVLNDEYVLPKGEQIMVGLYAPDGAALGEALELK